MTVASLESLEKLQTYDHSQLLDVIDKLRAQGLSNLLPLPQLIVCGDQSSGKSSVLEAISGVPFPKKDVLCTRFATEVMLRRSGQDEEPHAKVSILPGQDRSETDRINLQNFSSSLTDVSQLPDAIDDAKAAMGLGSYGASGNNAFSTDVLRLEVSGPRMPQLTIVDLPGLIHSENKNQTLQDVELVSQLVQSYMCQSRSIILAVVSAKYDIANQIVLKKARQEDPTGQRTLGIITKPDTLHHGSENEKAFINLARNLDVHFNLGWHVVRNLDSHELADQRGRNEIEGSFFRDGNWRTLTASMLGIGPLRKKLSEVLFRQITRELPNLMADIEKCRVECQDELTRLGRDRKTEHEQRLFLAELSQKTKDLCVAGCNGTYDDEFFRPDDEADIMARRLRSVIQNQGMQFADLLVKHGAKYRVEEGDDLAKGYLTEDNALDRIVGLIRVSRGRELPGTFNPMLISEVFQEYSRPWHRIARDFIYRIWQHAKMFLGQILACCADESAGQLFDRFVVAPEMDAILDAANKALKEVRSELVRHASTFNYKFLDEVVKQENKKRRQDLRSRLDQAFEEKESLRRKDTSWLLDFLTTSTQVDLDRSAAKAILDRMQAYYQTSLQRFLDNVPSLVIESVIVGRLKTIFEPVKIWNMDPHLVNQIAGESVEKEAYRQSMNQKFAILCSGEATCKRYAAQLKLDDDALSDSDSDNDEEEAVGPTSLKDDTSSIAEEDAQLINLEAKPVQEPDAESENGLGPPPTDDW